MAFFRHGLKNPANNIRQGPVRQAAIPFEDLFEKQWSRPLIIVTFLGLLELVRMNLVRLFQEEWFGAIHVTRRFVPAGEDDAPGSALLEDV